MCRHRFSPRITGAILIALLGVTTSWAADNGLPIYPQPPTVKDPGQPVGNAVRPILDVLVDGSILKLDPATSSAATMLTASVLNLPTGANVTYTWQQVQDEFSPVAADVTRKRIAFSATTGEKVKVTFSDWGVYEVRVTAVDAQHGIHLARNAWINVWDFRSSIVVDGKPDPLCVAPGIAPPKVRHLTPDPGPFAHPRLYCTEADWKDIHGRCLEGGSKIAAKSFLSLKSFVEKPNPKTGDPAMLQALDAYVAGGFRGPAPDLLAGTEPNADAKAITKVLSRRADYLEYLGLYLWISADPSQPREHLPAAEQERRRSAARMVAGFSNAWLKACWTPEGGFTPKHPAFLVGIDQPGRSVHGDGPHSLAVAYDFLAPWMTAEEQRVTRNFLFAVGPGRETGGRGYPTRINGVIQYHGVGRGIQQNGNFANFEDGQIIPALVVSGEDAGVDAVVMKTFFDPPKPKDHDKFSRTQVYDFSKPVEVDTGGNHPTSKPYPVSMTWPWARKVDVDNLLRQVYWNQDGNVSPWGFITEQEAYHSTSTSANWPTGLMMARFGGHNQYINGYFYNIVSHILYHLYPGVLEVASTNFRSHLFGINHHAGAGGTFPAHMYLLKYMYPDDPAVDYTHAARAPRFENRPEFLLGCLYGMDPTITNLHDALPPVATAKDLPLTKVDPEEGMVVMRSDWSDQAVQVDLDCGFKHYGHMNAEKNAITFYALGRSWAAPTGFHKIYSTWQSTVHVQRKEWASCPYTQGYVGANPCFKPQVPSCDMPNNFPSAPAKLLEATEAPDRSWSLAAGDATWSYRYLMGGENRIALPRSERMYPGLLEEMTSRQDLFRRVFVESLNPYYNYVNKEFMAYPPTAVEWAIRSVLLMRGPRPYALVVDDIRKEAGAGAHNFRWMMNNRNRVKLDAYGGESQGDFSMGMEPGSTPTDAVLFHTVDAGDKLGNPRLLVRDVSEIDNRHQPTIRLDRTKFEPPKGLETDFYLGEQVNRVLIDRSEVVEPHYKVLLFPYRTGEPLPITTWNADKTVLTIDLGTGRKDTIAFTTNSDHRTRMKVSHTPP